MPAPRLSRCRAFAAVALAVLLAVPAAAADKPCAKPKADAKPLEIKVVGSDHAIFSAASTERSFALPLSLPPGVARAELTVQLVEVRRDKLVDAGVQGRFKVQKSLGGAADAPPAVHFEVQKIDTLLPAAYQVLLAFQHRCGTAVSPLTLTLERPAAQITPPGKINIDVWVPLGFGTAKGQAVPAEIQLQPADGSQVSALRNVEFRDDRYRAANGDPVPIALGAAASSAPAGRPLAVTLSPAGVPTGVNQGKLQVLSPDLKSPLWIEVEVRGRLYRAWIPLLVACGIGAGFLLRVVMQAWLERLQAGSEGLAALGELQGRVRDIDDALFKRRTQEPLAALREALLARDTTRIKSRQEAARKTVDEAMLLFREALTAAEARLRDLRGLAAGTGALPPDMQAAVDAIEAPCDEAADRLKANDATGALERLDAVQTRLQIELERCAPLAHDALATHDREISALRAWLDPQQHSLRGLDGTEPRFADASYVAAAEPLRNLNAARMPELALTLGAWRSLGRSRSQGLRRWAEWLRKDCLEIDARIERRIASRDLLTSQRQTTLDVVQAVADALAKASSHPDAFAAVPDLPALARRAADASATLIRKLAQGHGKLDETLRQRIESALETWRFFEAIKALPIPPASAQLSAAEADTGRPQVPPAAPLTPLMARTTPGKEDAPAAPPVVDAAVLELWQARTARELVCAKALQTAVVAAVMLGASYVFYEDRFLGTPTDLLGLFFWGFTSDVSMAGLWALAGGLAAKLKN